MLKITFKEQLVTIRRYFLYRKNSILRTLCSEKRVKYTLATVFKNKLDISCRPFLEKRETHFRDYLWRKFISKFTSLIRVSSYDTLKSVKTNYYN